MLTSAAPGRTVTTSYAWGDTEAEKRKHLLQQSVSPLGTVSTFQYDAYGNTIETQKKESGASTAKFIKTTAAYTAAGTYAVSQTDARGKTATTVTDPDRGTVTQSTDPLGQEVNSQYDTLRRLTKTSTMLNNQEVKTEHTYDSQTGYLTSTSHNTDGDPTHSVVYHFGYDSLGRQTGVSVGSNVLSTTYYDAIRRMVDRIVFGNGGQVKYLYDSFSRVTGIRYDGADENRFSYGYDAQGRTAYVTDHARGVTVYTDYDLAGRPCRKTHLAGTAHAYTGELTYNAYELPNTFTEYVGAARARYVTGFGYDDENRLTALTYGTGSAAYAYDGLGRVTQRTVQPASTPIQTAYTYVLGGYGAQSATGLIQTITQGGVTLTYTYDDNGNIVSVSDGTKTTGYVYDAIGQLIRVNDETDTTAGAAGTTWVYTYDLGGNILTKAAYPYTTGAVGTATESHAYTYGNAGWKDQLTAFDGATITYDAMGNPLNDGTWAYTWEHGRQLKQMTRIDGTETVTFEYNEDGLRTKKTATSTGTTEYTLHGKNIVHMTQGNHALHFYYDAQSKPSIVIFDGTPYAYLYNLQGDVIALVDGTGAKVVEYTYDAWGKVLSTTGSLATTLGTVQPFRYRGYVYDVETEFYYLRSRYYSPERCRWINEDAFVSTGQGSVECNVFAYCLNNPIDGYDPGGFARNNTDDYNNNNIPDYLEERWVEYTNRSRAILNGGECRDVTDEVNAALNNAISELSDMETVEKLFAFPGMVDHECAWDIKLAASWENTIGTDYPGAVVIYEGHYYTPEILGNYTYAVLGKACGFGLPLLLYESMHAAHYPTPGTYQYDDEMQDWLFIVNGFYREH